MAAFANTKVITPKSAFPIMTSQTTLAASGGVMIQRLGLGHLSSLRHAGKDLMTLCASYLVMLSMTEADPKGPGKLRRPGITAKLMTRPARRDVASAGLRTLSVTSETGCVRVKA
jgi:hypothetical protein